MPCAVCRSCAGLTTTALCLKRRNQSDAVAECFELIDMRIPLRNTEQNLKFIQNEGSKQLEDKRQIPGFEEIAERERQGLGNVMSLANKPRNAMYLQGMYKVRLNQIRPYMLRARSFAR